MTSCSLYASGLVPDVSGAVPTFSYRQDNHNGDYFGIQMTYLRGTSTCYQGGLPQFTPVIQNEAAKFTEECVFRTQGATYTGIFCSDTPVTQIPNGILTVSYVNWNRNQPTPIPFYATFGSSPAPKTMTATANAVATSTSTVTATAPAGFTSTATDYSASTTQTQTSTVIITQTQTMTNTNYVSSCSTSASASKSSSSSTSSTSPSSSTKPSSSSSSTSPSRTTSSSAAPSSSASGLACPKDDGRTYTVGDKVFQVQCDYNRDGPVIGESRSVEDLGRCIDICAKTDGCTWSTYFANSNTCQLKNGSGALAYDTFASGASLKNPPASSSTGSTTTSSKTDTLLSSSSSSSSRISTTTAIASSTSSSPLGSSKSTDSSISTASATSTTSRSIFTTQSSSSSTMGSSSSRSDANSSSSSRTAPSTAPTSSSSSSAFLSSSSALTTSSKPVTSSSNPATSASTTNAFSSATSITPSASAAPTSISCPGDNGRTIDTPAGAFVVECYLDRSGGDLSTQYPAGGLNGCIQLCANTPSCIDVSYLPNGPCYLKSAQGTPNSNKAIWGARLASATRSSVSIASSATSTRDSTTSTGPVATSPVMCPGSDGQTISTNVGTFVVECGIDRNGGDMANSPVYPSSYEGCIAACAARDGCLDVSYVPKGPCYLKSIINTPGLNGIIIGGRLIGSRPKATVSASASTGASATGSPAQTVTVTTTISDTAYQCTCTPASGLGSGPGSLSCPSSDGQTYTSDCGAKYSIECYSDRYGDDIPGGFSPASTLSECIADCDNTDGCIDVSWVSGIPGTCYKKSSIAEIRRNDNIWGARQLTGCVSSTKLRLHRKRVVREPAAPKKRASGGERSYYGPDYTYTQGVTTSTKTATATTVSYTTVTVTPPNSGATTKTVYTTATKTATITNGATTTQTQQVTVTTCPAITKRAIL